MLHFCNSSSSIIRKVYKGLPQGGVLSALLYLIYVKDICKGLGNRIHVSQFVDDIGVYTPVCIPNLGKRSIETAVTTINSRLNNLGLSLGPEKTIVVYFNKKGIQPGTCTISINIYEIKSSTTARFLGILFDYQLKFRERI